MARPQWLHTLWPGVTPPPNLALPTLRGRQLWGDVRILAGWRIQCSLLSGHYRLLDPTGRRRAWGDRPVCEAALDAEIEQGLAPTSAHIVVVLHGIFRSNEAMRPMTGALRRAGYEVADVNYPSTRASLEDHAAQVRQILRQYPTCERVSFVGHSMGGLVARLVLGTGGAWRDTLSPNRLVMIATPNHGARLAEDLGDIWGYRAIAGPAGVQLSPAHAERVPHPTVPFGLIAGIRGDGRGWNPLLDGENDMTVTLADLELEGAADCLHVRGIHTFIQSHPDVITATLRFLEVGSFQGPQPG